MVDILLEQGIVSWGNLEVAKQAKIEKLYEPLDNE